MDERRGVVVTPRLVLGLFAIAAGTLLVLGRMGILDVGPLWRFWPLILIAVGLTKLAQPQYGRGGGLTLLIVGSWFLLRELRIVDLDFRDLFPFLLLLLGVVLVVKSLGPGGGRRGGGPVADASAIVHPFAMLGAASWASSSQQFQGGSANAILGHCEIDLRQAAIEGEAVIDAFALWGGIEIVVPETWEVVLRGMPILGGFENSAVRPAGGSSQRLVVKGLALMGGVEIKNHRDRR